MNQPPNNREEKIAQARHQVQEELGKSQHTLADGILCLTHDVMGIKTEMRTMSDTVSKLYKVVAGDIEFGQEGLIQHNESSKARHMETMKKVVEMDKEMGARLEEVEDGVGRLDKKVDIELTKLKVIGGFLMAAIPLLVGILKDYFWKH